MILALVTLVGWPDAARGDLVMRLALDEGWGEVARDASGQGHDGAIRGATWAEGKVGKALAFGDGQYLEVPAKPSLSLSKSLTLDLWIFPSAVDDGRNHRVLTMFPFPGPAEHRTGWCLYVNGRERPKSLMFMMYHAAGGQARLTAVSWYDKLTANRWYHVVVAYDGRRLQLIVDGTVVDAQQASGEIEAAGPLRVSDQAASFNGLIDEVSIYSDGQMAKETAEMAAAHNESHVAAEYVPGKVGDCLRVERSGYVEVAVPERLRATRELTIDAWVCPTAVDDGSNHIILAMQTWVSPGAYCLHINDKQLDRALVFMAYNQANAAKSVAWKGGLEADRWYHVVVVYDGKEMRLYVDGSLKASEPHTGELGAAGPIRISDRPAGPFFSGRIDELRIYDKALAVDEQGNVRADVAPVLHLPFEKRTDEVVPDASGHGHHGQLVKPQRPYEMVRAGRREERTPLVDFEDLSGWEVAQHFGARCALRRSQLQQMWGSYVAEVTYSGPSRASYAELRPKTPIPIRGEFDCVNLWVYGDWWGYSTQRKTLADLGITPASLAVRIRDAQGEMHELDFGRLDANDWFLAHGKFAAERWKGKWGAATYRSWGGDNDKRIQFPAEFVSLILRPCADEAPRAIYLDSLCFYKEDLKPLALPPPPSHLPFPTTPHTILPTCKSAFENRVARGGQEYVFEYRGKDCKLAYLYRPTDGSLSDIRVAHNDTFRFTPCHGGGLEVERDGQFIRLTGKLVSEKLEGERLTTRWQAEGVAFDLSLAIKGKSLIADYAAHGGQVARVTFGRTMGTPAPKLIDVPYLVISGTEGHKQGPFVVHSNGLFMLGLVDWYQSNASELFAERREVAADSAAFNGGALYERKTDGRRNDVRARLFLTVSPDFHEVLPNIPNPPSPLRERASQHVYAMLGAHRPEFAQRLKNYGLDQLMAQHHEPIWHPGNTAFSSTYKPVPALGDEGLKQYSRQIHDLGYLFGLYTCFTDASPSNEVWNENHVSLNPDGGWRRGWFACYLVKPSVTHEWESRTAQRLKKDFSTDTVYCDVHTCGPPWRHVDYDARVPGAAMFRPVLESYGALLLNEQRVHGPTFSEGHYHWLYAGLPTGNYATIVGTAEPWKLPLLPDFDLLKMHPLQADIAMGHNAFIFFGRLTKEWDKDGHPHNRYFNQHLAATIAYGHLGTLFDEAAWGLPGVFKQYFMLQQLQQRYVTDEVEAIRYHDGAQFLDTSAALADDAYKRGRFYVKYRKGLELFVNYHAHENWEVEAAGRKYVLPPYGFVAHKPGDILEFSALVDGHRAEYADTPAYLYADTWNEDVTLPKLRLRGAAAVKKGAAGQWWVIPLGDLKQVGGRLQPGPSRGCPTLSLRLNALFPEGAPKVSVWACSEDGTPQAVFPSETADGWLTLRPSTEAAKYEIAPK